MASSVAEIAAARKAARATARARAWGRAGDGGDGGDGDDDGTPAPADGTATLEASAEGARRGRGSREGFVPPCVNWRACQAVRREAALTREVAARAARAIDDRRGVERALLDEVAAREVAHQMALRERDRLAGVVAAHERRHARSEERLRCARMLVPIGVAWAVRVGFLLAGGR